MGYVKIKGTIGNAQQTTAREVELLADTGTFYTIIPPALAKELAITATAKTKLTLADKRLVEAQISLAYIKILDRDGILPVAIIDSPEPLLGATTLEGLGLRVDPTNGKVEHSRPYGLAALQTKFPPQQPLHNSA